MRCCGAWHQMKNKHKLLLTVCVCFVLLEPYAKSRRRKAQPTNNQMEWKRTLFVSHKEIRLHIFSRGYALNEINHSKLLPLMAEEGAESTVSHNRQTVHIFWNWLENVLIPLTIEMWYANRIASNRIRYVSYHTKPIRLFDDRSKNMI